MIKLKQILAEAFKEDQSYNESEKLSESYKVGDTVGVVTGSGRADRTGTVHHVHPSTGVITVKHEDGTKTAYTRDGKEDLSGKRFTSNTDKIVSHAQYQKMRDDFAADAKFNESVDDRWELYAKDEKKGYTLHHIPRNAAEPGEHRFKHTLNGKTILSHSKYYPDEMSKQMNEWTSSKEDGREISAKKNIMRNVDGVMKPGKQAIAKHNYNRPKVEESNVIRKGSDGRTMISAAAVIKRARELAGTGNKPTPMHKMAAHKELSKSMAESDRSEFSANRDMSITGSGAPKKIRLKNKNTNATVGIFSSHREAMAAHATHPLRKSLFIESNIHSLVADLISSKPELLETKKDVLSFSEYQNHFNAVLAEMDEQIAEKKQLLLDKKKKVINDIEVDESSPFDWKKPTEPRYDWSKLSKDADKKFADDSEEGVTKHKAGQKPKKDPNAPKKSVGRPKGEYAGGYNLKGGQDRGAKIGAKVHTPERAANYKEMIDSRKHFKEVMNAAIKKRQAELA